jgi:hypothetical protein
MSELAHQPAAHSILAELPQWSGKTVAMLATTDGTPHVIPVSAPVRSGAQQILISLRRTRGSLARLRANATVALLVLAEGDIAFTARGRARVLEEPMAVDGAYAAVQIDVETIDDHRQPDFRITGGIDREWVNVEEQSSLRDRVLALTARAREHREP